MILFGNFVFWDYVAILELHYHRAASIGRLAPNFSDVGGDGLVRVLRLPATRGETAQLDDLSLREMVTRFVGKI